MNHPLPYGRQSIDKEDILAVVQVLQSDWLTTGPMVSQFENAVAHFCDVKHAVALSSGTAALHAAMYAANIKPGDEVIVPSITFVATANAIVFQGGIPVFVDIDAKTLLIDPQLIESKITSKTRAIVTVDYAGQPSPYDVLRTIADRHQLILIADACHAIGAEYHGKKVGTLADLTVFSFHPVKQITTGEGGMVVTNHENDALRMRCFRNHGITTDHHQRESQGSWFYEMVDLGYNYRITDLQCALGLSQLKKLNTWIKRRHEIAEKYDHAFQKMAIVKPLYTVPNVLHAHHLYVIQLQLDRIKVKRQEIYRELREQGIGVNVHYIPVHLQPYYRERFKTFAGLCPQAEKVYEQILSLPLFPTMIEEDVERVILAIKQIEKRYGI